MFRYRLLEKKRFGVGKLGLNYASGENCKWSDTVHGEDNTIGFQNFSKPIGSQNSQISLNSLYFKIPYNPKLPILLSSRHN